jgi:hypothetical protein
MPGYPGLYGSIDLSYGRFGFFSSSLPSGSRVVIDGLIDDCNFCTYDEEIQCCGRRYLSECTSSV